MARRAAKPKAEEPAAKPEVKLRVVDSKAAPDAQATGDKPENWADQPDSEAHQGAAKLYKLIATQYRNQQEISDRIEEYWNIYNAMPDENLQYAGNSNGYVPVVRDAINARTKRTLRQLFPVNHKHVDGLASDGKTPYTQLSLLEHYIRKTKLKAIVRSDLVAGDVTGQWGLHIDWLKTTRRVADLVKRNPIVEEIEGENVEALEIPDPMADEEEDLEERDITEEGPEITDFAVEDLAVIPPTCNDLQKAKAASLRLRLSKERVEQLVDEGVFILPEDGSVDDLFDRGPAQRAHRDRAKTQTHDAGVKTEGTDKHLLVFMVYTQLEFEEGVPQSAVVYYAGPNSDEILGILKNPLWSGKVPIISEPVDRVKGSFFGKSKVEPVKFMQWNLVDFWNMGQDSAMYSLLPIWAVDPTTTPQWASLVMGLAAVWPVGPNSVKPITSPQLYKDSLQLCAAMKSQIWESMEVNEMMMGKMPAGRKNNQLMGQMQQEQQTNIVDHAERYEEVVLEPLCEFLFEFDQQYRTEEITVESRGEIGVKAAILDVPPQQWGERYFFRWAGTAFVSSTQRMQQQIAWMNVLKGIPPPMLGGRRLDLTPILEAGTEQIFGPEVAPRILIDERNMFTVEPEMENSIMYNGMAVDVHEADNDQKHLQEHMQEAQRTGDPAGLYKAHIGAHMLSMKTKRERQQAQQQGAPGGPGGAGPGVAGAPRPGAQPGAPRPAQNPPGAVQQDAMAGAPGRG